MRKTKQDKKLKKVKLINSAYNVLMNSDDRKVQKIMKLIQEIEAEETKTKCMKLLRSLSNEQLKSIIDGDEQITYNILKKEGNKYKNMKKIFIVDIRLSGFEEFVSREMKIPATLSLEQLADIIMSTMKCDGSHMYEISIKDKTYSMDIDSDYGRPKFLMKDYHLYDFNFIKNSHFSMLYDFGDCFQFIITIKEVIKYNEVPTFVFPTILSGKGYGIWEDAKRIMYFYYYENIIIDEEFSEYGQYMSKQIFDIEKDNNSLPWVKTKKV